MCVYLYTWTCMRARFAHACCTAFLDGQYLTSVIRVSIPKIVNWWFFADTVINSIFFYSKSSGLFTILWNDLKIRLSISAFYDVQENMLVSKEFFYSFKLLVPWRLFEMEVHFILRWTALQFVDMKFGWIVFLLWLDHSDVCVFRDFDVWWILCPVLTNYFLWVVFWCVVYIGVRFRETINFYVTCVRKLPRSELILQIQEDFHELCLSDVESCSSDSFLRNQSWLRAPMALDFICS